MGSNSGWRITFLHVEWLFGGHAKHLKFLGGPLAPSWAQWKQPRGWAFNFLWLTVDFERES